MAQDFPLKPLATRYDEPEMVIVESESFAAFDRWVDAQLDRLVGRWAHMAAPNAKRASTRELRFGK